MHGCKTLDISALCGHWMQFSGPAWSDCWRGQLARETERVKGIHFFRFHFLAKQQIYTLNLLFNGTIQILFLTFGLVQFYGISNIKRSKPLLFNGTIQISFLTFGLVQFYGISNIKRLKPLIVQWNNPDIICNVWFGSVLWLIKH